MEDKGQFSFHIVNITSGSIDDSWTSGDFATVKALFETYLNAIKVVVPSTHTFSEYRAYGMTFDPDDPFPNPRKGSGHSAFAESGPPIYVSTTSIAGTASSVPYQQAMTCTLRTSWPKHWGRVYIPGGGGVDSSGRYSSTNRTTVANATRALVDDLADANFLVLVPVTQVNKAFFHGLLGVTDLVVDDIPDVIRRRRPKQAAARTIGA